MPYPKNPDSMAWETVFLPFSGGVDLRTPQRLVTAPRLKRLENARFDEADAGIRKRRGHVSHFMRDTTSLTAVDAGGIPSGPATYLPAQEVADGLTSASGWIYGFGVNNRGRNTDALIADAGFCRGMASRDDEVVAWDGFRLYSKPTGASPGQGFGTPVPAVIPVARTTPLSRVGVAASQQHVDMGIGDGIGVLAWISGTGVLVTVFDPATGTPYVTAQAGTGGGVVGVRVLPMGDWVHVFASTATDLVMTSYHRSNPWTARVGLTTFGACDTNFDVRKVTDTLALVVRRHTDDTARATFLDVDGSSNDTFFSHGTTLTTTFLVLGQMAIAQHPTTSEICLVWYSNDGVNDFVRMRVYTGAGGVAGTERTVVPALGFTDILHLTVEAKYLLGAPGVDSEFQIFYDDNATVPITVSGLATRSAYTAGTTRRWALLASHAWRVGNKVFVTCRARYGSALQQAYVACDEALLPCGRLEYGTAQDSSGMPEYLTSVHFVDGQPPRNRVRFTAALVYRNRVDSRDNDQFDEESVKRVDWDFLPPLRSAQFGHSTYFAGAMLGSYDGSEYGEAAPLFFPDGVTAASTGVAGNPAGTNPYTYIVRWAFKNAQGEEQVSAGVSITATTVALRKINVVIPTLGFTHRDMYALVYRNESTPGTQWYLVSSRDPTATGDNGFVANNPGASTVTFSDNASDASLLAKEKNPGDAGLLEPFAPPACEVIAEGRNRLWLAGGEIPQGQVIPSLTYFQGKGASFNGFLSTEVDRGSGPITAFAFMGNSTFIFKRNRLFAFEADGPSNAANGSFDAPRVVLADTGAVSQEGILLTTRGVLFPSPAGIKLLATNYQLLDVGAPVRQASVDSTVSSGILIAADQEARFYCANGPALVFNYKSGEWSTWRGLEATGAVVGVSGLVTLSKTHGSLWEETEGAWTDDGLGYRFLLETASLHASGLQGFQRVRRVALVGDLLGAHSLTCQAFYNDRDFPEDSWTWVVASDLNASLWGDGNWGDGLWGDVDADIGGVGVVALKDGVYAHRHRLARQKCSRVSFVFHDGGAQSEGPALTELALEIGNRGGLSRLAPQTTT